MALFFLLIIYPAFISLGLPDSLLGSAWPVMKGEFGVSLSSAGIISMIISCGTIISSLLSGKMLKRFGTGMVTFVSCLMTAVALIGFSYSNSFLWFIFLALPLGLGAGAVDSGLNTYVAAHYKAHHMSWLHCFWGIGATLGPIIMSYFIREDNSWRKGYFWVSIIQFALVLILLFTLPLWKRTENREETQKEPESEKRKENKKETSYFKIKGVKYALVSFFFYCGAESTMGLWGSSYLVQVKDISPSSAARWVSLFYVGITVGRLLTGFITMKVSNKNLIRMGQLICLGGVGVLLLPLPSMVSILGFILIGLGCAPIFPCMLHETPVRFGKEQAQSIMGFQMACAYVGSTMLPPALGFIASKTTIGIFPIFVLCYCIGMLISSEKINLFMKYRKA